jgi:hypothetical protein
MDADHDEAARAVLSLPARDLFGDVVADVARDRPEVDEERLACQLLGVRLFDGPSVSPELPQLERPDAASIQSCPNAVS